MQRAAFSAGPQIFSEPLEEEPQKEDKAPWLLKELSPLHKQVMALLVQGVDRGTIAEVCDITPEYVTMLARQPLCQEYFKQLSEFADLRLVALAEKSVNIINEVMDAGNNDERLKAVKLQMEATGRVGGKSTIILNQINLNSALGSAASELLSKLRVVHAPAIIDNGT